MVISETLSNELLPYRVSDSDRQAVREPFLEVTDETPERLSCHKNVHNRFTAVQPRMRNIRMSIVAESSVRYRGCMQQSFTMVLLDDDGELVEDDLQMLIERVQKAE